MILLSSSRFKGALQTLFVRLPEHTGKQLIRSREDEEYVIGKGLFYLKTAPNGYEYTPIATGNDFYKLELSSMIEKVIPEYPQLEPAYWEAKRHWKRAAVFPDASADNVSRYSNYPKPLPEVSPRMREAMNFVRVNLVNCLEPIVPYSTGKVLSDESMLKNTACGMEVRRCFPKLRNPESGVFDKHRPTHFVKDTFKDGNLRIRSKRDAYYTYYYTLKDRGKRFIDLTLFPATLGYRRQVSQRHKNKLRTMMIPSDDVIIEEARYVLPFIRKVMKVGSKILTFSHHIETGIAPCIRDSLEYQARTLGSPVSIDYSRWDTTLTPELLCAAFEIFFSLFDIHKVQSVDDRTWSLTTGVIERIRKLVLYIINTPILLPKDEVTGKSYIIRKFGGMPSGCMSTNIIGSICNALITCIAVRDQTMVYPLRLKVQGDDTLLYPPVELDLARYSKVAEEYGLIINVDKCAHFKRDGYVTYLGHEFTTENVSRDPVKTFASLLFTEKSVTCYADCVLRVLSLFSAEHVLAENDMAILLFKVFERLGGKAALRCPDDRNSLRYARYFFKEYYNSLFTDFQSFNTRKKEMLASGGGHPFPLCLYPLEDYFQCGYLLLGNGRLKFLGT